MDETRVINKSETLTLRAFPRDKAHPFGHHRSCRVAVVPASGNSRERRDREREREYW